ncbi:MAG: mannonate dehydratase [Candidatus Latescibacteria bacterium]|nr:mannonate dehydratase [Candidatus Latescibacterota bacterium]
MKLMDHLSWNDVTDENLNFYKAIGVDCLLIAVPPEMADGQDKTEEFKRMKAFVEAHGLELYVLHSGSLPRERIVYGLPGREEQLERWCTVLRAIGAAGVPATATTFYAISHFRTSSTKGRGGATYSTFDYAEFLQNPPVYPGREITEERLWENLAYFLQRVIPVAEEAGVRIALHPDDPPISEPLGGAARIVVSVANYQRIFDLMPSDANGMLFCQGCVAEMGANVYETIRYMGVRNKIVFVHFRNIRGRSHTFQEVFIDEGDVDMVRAMETYRAVEFNGPFMMDHTPGVPHPSGAWVGRAYANGYIRALMQAVYR